MLASRDGLGLGPEGPSAPAGTADRALRHALAAALRCARGEADAAPVAVAVPRASLERPYEVLIAPLAVAAVAVGAGGSRRPDPDQRSRAHPEPPPRLLAGLYGLTAAEARVAAALAAGHTLGRIAEASGYTREAARWHLKQIFQKTGTHRQAQLVKLLRSGPLAWIHLDDRDR